MKGGAYQWDRPVGLGRLYLFVFLKSLPGQKSQPLQIIFGLRYVVALGEQVCCPVCQSRESLGLQSGRREL